MLFWDSVIPDEALKLEWNGQDPVTWQSPLVTLPVAPESLLAERFRRAGLSFLVK
jgi:hypothetical protein